jgi:alpha-tubulin suppressor-like RCC1 family protein
MNYPNASTRPKQLVHSSGNNWVSVECAGNTTVAIKANGKMYSWGRNSRGEAGVGSFNSPITSPSEIGIGQQWIQISTGPQGYQTLAESRTLGLHAWGSNQYGAIGDGTLTNRNVPTLIWYNSRGRLSAGIDFSFLWENGEVYSWGLGYFGALGTGDNSSYYIPNFLENIE